MTRTRILFTTDVHGSELCFLKFLAGQKAYSADVIILGGDMTGKMIIPLVQQDDGSYKGKFLNEERTAKGEEELQKLEKQIRYTGYYPHRSTRKEMDELNADKSKVDKLFNEIVVDTVERWIKITEEKLKGQKVKCFICPGNDDFLSIDKAFGSSEIVMNPEGKVVQIDDRHEMISTGYSNVTPWNAPRDIPEDELKKRLEAMIANLKDKPNAIYQTHCPPYGTHLDQAPKLDTSLDPPKPVLQAGQQVLVPVGSTSVREVIERDQPLLGLHGHIHESRGVEKIGRTLCVNPGSEYTEGILKASLILLEDEKVKSYQFVSG